MIGNDNVDIQTDAMKRSLCYNLGTNHNGCTQHFSDKIYLPSPCTPLGMGLICTPSPQHGRTTFMVPYILGFFDRNYCICLNLVFEVTRG